jgi:hypothetical protein
MACNSDITLYEVACNLDISIYVYFFFFFFGMQFGYTDYNTWTILCSQRVYDSQNFPVASTTTWNRPYYGRVGVLRALFSNIFKKYLRLIYNILSWHRDFINNNNIQFFRTIHRMHITKYRCRILHCTIRILSYNSYALVNFIIYSHRFNDITAKQIFRIWLSCNRYSTHLNKITNIMRI